MTRFAFISHIDPGPARLQQAQHWRDRTLLPRIAAAAGDARPRVYCAFNTSQLAVTAQFTDEGTARAALEAAAGQDVPHRSELAQLSYEMLQPGTHAQEDEPILYSVRFKVPDDWVDEFDRWYEEEHVPMIYGSRHWSMTRRYRLIGGNGDGATHLALHYLSDARGFDAPELTASRLTPWRKKFLTQRWFTHVEKRIYFRQTPEPASR